MQRTLFACPSRSRNEDIAADSFLVLAHEDVLASAFDDWLYNSKVLCTPNDCCFGYCNVIKLVIIITIEDRYIVVQHFIELAYIIALLIIDR
jgi:hypothetical protein